MASAHLPSDVWLQCTVLKFSCCVTCGLEFGEAEEKLPQRWTIKSVGWILRVHIRNKQGRKDSRQGCPRPQKWMLRVCMKATFILILQILLVDYNPQFESFVTTKWGRTPAEHVVLIQKPEAMSSAAPSVETDRPPLPPGWRSYMSPEGLKYYVNSSSKGKLRLRRGPDHRVSLSLIHWYVLLCDVCSQSDTWKSSSCVISAASACVLKAPGAERSIISSCVSARHVLNAVKCEDSSSFLPITESQQSIHVNTGLQIPSTWIWSWTSVSAAETCAVWGSIVCLLPPNRRHIRAADLHQLLPHLCALHLV